MERAWETDFASGIQVIEKEFVVKHDQVMIVEALRRTKIHFTREFSSLMAPGVFIAGVQNER